MKKRYFYSIDYLRLLMVITIFVYTFGVAEAIQPQVAAWLQAFTATSFCVQGFMVLRPSERMEGRLKRAWKRMLILVVSVAVVYGAINYLYYQSVGDSLMNHITARSVFGFLVCCNWPFDIGVSIWYLQVLLYAYSIFFVLNKIGWLQYDRALFVVTFVAAVVTGELSAVFGIPAFAAENYLLIAFPYMLLGRMLGSRESDFLAKLRTKYLGIIVLSGALLYLMESLMLQSMGVLVYRGHFAGYALIAMGVCLYCIRRPDLGKMEKFPFSIRRMALVAFLVYNPIVFMLRVMRESKLMLEEVPQAYLLLLTLLLAAFIAVEYEFVSRAVSDKWKETKRKNASKSHH